MNCTKLFVTKSLKKSPSVMLMDKLITYKGPFKIEQVDDKFFRSTNVTTKEIPFLNQMGIKIIVNLKSLTSSENRKLSEEAAKQGIKFINFPINPFRLKKWTPAAIELVQNLKEKAVVQCAFGADRTGYITALREHFGNGLPMSEAINKMRQHGYHKKIFGHIESCLMDIEKRKASGL